MRQLLKITTTFVLTLLLSAGMAFGQSNDAQTTQENSTNASATQTQSGSNNIARAVQSESDNVTLKQVQSGADHFARARQLNSSNNSKVNQNQSGTNNEARARQFAFQSSLIRQTQSGEDNFAKADQAYRRNTEAYQKQSGESQIARITQRSNLGFVRQNQIGGSGNTAITRQLNKVRNVEARTFQLSSTGSKAVIVQELSNKNVARITQDGCTSCNARINQ